MRFPIFRLVVCLIFLSLVFPGFALGSREKSPEIEVKETGDPESESPVFSGIPPIDTSDSDPRNWDRDTLETTLGDVLRVLDDLILSGDPENEVLGIYSRVRTAMNIQAIQVIFERDHELTTSSALQSVFFSVENEGDQESPAYLVINPYFFTILDETPSLALSLLIEAMGHSHHFLSLGQDFFVQYEHPVERYLFSMDALYLQALFVSQYLSGVFPLTPYEEYLIQGLEVDGLASVSLYLRGVDQDVVFAMAEQAEAVRDGALPLEIFLDQIQNLVQLLTDQHNQVFLSEDTPGADATPDDLSFFHRARYITTVSTGTYLKYGIWIINDLLLEYQGTIQEDQVLVTKVRRINEDSARLYAQFVQEAYDVNPFRLEFLGSFFPGN